MSQQNNNQYNYKRWFITQHKPIFDISLSSDERDYNEEVVFSNQIIGINDDGVGTVEAFVSIK